jgi:catechol 2,3-dioxygenase-like lactoylglutathione lyase family enzyme
LIAKDWQRLVRFYSEVFGCRPAGPERDQAGGWLDDLTGVGDAHLNGRHLLLPGHGPSGPTLEIYTYRETVNQTDPTANRAGFGHIAFEVDDVQAAFEAVLAHGGHRLGKISGTRVPGVGDLRVVYVRDPELNIIELQSWAR